MGTVIGTKADVERIAAHGRTSLMMAEARGGDIAAAAAARLGPAMAEVDAAATARKAAHDLVDTLWAAVVAEEAASDKGIGVVRDMMWNELGRPRRSPYFDQVFPGGVTTYTDVDVRKKALMMQVLRSRILSGAAPGLGTAVRAEWAADIETLRTSLDKAVAALLPAEAAASVADAAYRLAARLLQMRLRAFKQDLENLGVSKAHIFEIIPDAGPSTASSSSKPTNGSGPPPAGQPAPSTGLPTDTNKAA